MWLLIESFSLDRAACFLPAQKISLRSVSLSLSLFSALLFLSHSSAAANARGLSVARIIRTGINFQSPK